MGAFIVKQPNGRYCRFSTTVDCPTHINMTRDDYIELCVRNAAERAKKEAIEVLDKHLYDFSCVDEYFRPINMSKNMFKHIKHQMTLEDNDQLQMRKL